MNHDIDGESNKYGECDNGIEQDKYFGQVYNLVWQIIQSLRLNQMNLRT